MSNQVEEHRKNDAQLDQKQQQSSESPCSAQQAIIQPIPRSKPASSLKNLIGRLKHAKQQLNRSFSGQTELLQEIKGQLSQLSSATDQKEFRKNLLSYFGLLRSGAMKKQLEQLVLECYQMISQKCPSLCLINCFRQIPFGWVKEVLVMLAAIAQYIDKRGWAVGLFGGAIGCFVLNLFRRKSWCRWVKGCFKCLCCFCDCRCQCEQFGRPDCPDCFDY